MKLCSKILIMLIILSCVLSGCTSKEKGSNYAELSQTPLKTLGEKHELLIGACADVKQLRDEEFAEIFAENYSQLRRVRIIRTTVYSTLKHVITVLQSLAIG